MDAWSSRMGFILAATGAAVGIGNIWRFPSVVGRNGGGAYLVPFLVAMFVFAVPLMILEIRVGQRTRADIITTFRDVRSGFEALGWVVVGIVILILSYYLVITGWILGFLVAAVTGIEITMESFTGSYAPLVTFTITLVIVGGVLTLGVQSGIERMAKILVPLAFAILIGMGAFAVTLPGFADGIAFFVTPDRSVLTDPAIWTAAFGQSFFSLSAGMGILLTYGNYVDEALDVPGAALIIAVADLIVAVLAGIVIFPIVFTFDLEPTLGTELAFTTLPTAFSLLPSGGVIAVAFFGLLFAAAVTSAVSMMEVGVSTVRGSTRLTRRQSTVLVSGVVFLIGLPSALSYSPLELHVFGGRVLDVLDESVGALGLPVTALIIAVTFGYVAKREGVGDGWIEQFSDLSATYLLPPILIGIIASQVLVGVSFSAWRILPPAGRNVPLLSILFLVSIGIAGYVVVKLRTRTSR